MAPRAAATRRRIVSSEGDTTYHAMAFAEGDIDNDGRFEPLAADMMPYGSGADIDAAWGPVLPPDAYYTGRPGHTAIRSTCGTRQARSATARSGSVDATGWNWSAQFGDLHYDGGLDLYTDDGMAGEAWGHLPGAGLQSTGWPMPRRTSPLWMLSRSGSRSWKPLRGRSPGAPARPRMSGSKPRSPRGARHTLCFERDNRDDRGPQSVCGESHR